MTTHILYHDYIVWCGDLNFRLEENSFNYDQIVKAVESNELAGLLTRDQLTQARKQVELFCNHIVSIIHRVLLYS